MPRNRQAFSSVRSLVWRTEPIWSVVELGDFCLLVLFLWGFFVVIVGTFSAPLASNFFTDELLPATLCLV